MDFSLTDEQQMLRDSAERYVREAYGFDFVIQNQNEPSGCSEEQWRTFAQLGWLGVAVPEEMGGLGFSAIETAILMEELGRGLVREPYLGNAVLCAELLRQSNSGANLLPAMVAGESRFALADAEVQTLRTIKGVQVTEAAADGDGYRLNGGKMLVLDAPSAHQFLVTARCTSQNKMALFLVAADAPCIEMTAYPLIDGSWAADLVLEDVRVPASALVLAGDALESALSDAFDKAVLAQCAGALGGMERVMDITGEYVKGRVQFGQPIGAFQAIQHRLAEMFVEVQESRSALIRGLAHADAEAAERARAMSTAKTTIARAGKLVGALGIQLHGGYGMTEEYQASHYFRYLTAFEKKYGDLAFHLHRIASA